MPNRPGVRVRGALPDSAYGRRRPADGGEADVLGRDHQTIQLMIEGLIVAQAKDGPILAAGQSACDSLRHHAPW